MSVADIYAKMLQDPKNRIKTQVKQPTPFDDPKVAGEIGKKPEEEEQKIVKTEEITSEEKAYLADLDKRMAMRAAGKAPAPSSPDKIQVLENRITEVENALKLVMDTHMKLVKKLEKS